jgi:hypothetical protein
MSSIIVGPPSGSRYVEMTSVATLLRAQKAIGTSLNSLNEEMNADLDEVDRLRAKIKRVRDFANAIKPEDQSSDAKHFGFYISVDGSAPPDNGLGLNPPFFTNGVRNVVGSTADEKMLRGSAKMGPFTIVESDQVYASSDASISGKQAYAGYQSQIAYLEGKLDMLSTRSKEGQIKLQQRQGSYENAFNELTNIIKGYSNTKNKILQNLN